ncbi:MAG: capsid protein [Eubacterium sp.]
MQWVNNLKCKIRSWLNLTEAIANGFIINETLDYTGNAIKNKIWYRGDSAEIEQLYKQITNHNHSFWASIPSTGMELRKIHTGLPSIIIDTLADIVLADLNNFDFKNATQNLLWEDIAKENKIKKVFERALKETLYIGDGAFKISFDPDLSELPIVEFYSGEKIDIIYKRGRMKEVIFHTEYKELDRVYILHETYGYGYIEYKLEDTSGRPFDLNVLKQTKDLKPLIFNKALNMAVPLMIFESSRWEGRGQSLFDRKTDDFDALDEVWSQWMDAVRMGRSKEYLPESYIPKDRTNGALLKPNAFDNRFITVNTPLTESTTPPKIELVQPVIPYESYLGSYVTALDLCLQGLISPSTLGIDMKKLDNAEAQREKEKATLYTRGAIVGALEETLPQLIESVFKAYAYWIKQPYEEMTIDVDFGEYANPSFEAQVETVGKARANTIMSVEAAVDELYGDSKEETWKAEEVRLIKEELGIGELTEPTVGDIPAFGEDRLNPIDPSETTMDKLNGAQVTSLMNVIGMVKSGSVTRGEAISIITTTLGISRANAEMFIEDKISEVPANENKTNGQSQTPDQGSSVPDDKTGSGQDDKPDKDRKKRDKLNSGFGKK